MQAIQQWALTSPADDFWQTSIVLVVLSLAGFIYGFYFLIRKRIIEDIPTSRIRSAAQGYIELSGTGELLEPDRPITAPLTGIPCLWFSYSIAERRRSGRRKRWVVLEQGTSHEDFRLVDETGEAVVEPEGADVTPAATDIWYGSTRHPLADRQSPSRGGLFGTGIGRYRYIEKRLHPGEPLYAIGLFNTSGGSHSQFNVNADVRDLLREWKEDSDRLLARYDQDSDGQINLDEWSKVREAALAEVQRRHSEMKTLPPINVIGKTCDKRRPFLVSAIPEQSLVKRFGYYSVAGISVFFTSGIIASWLILTRLGG